MFTDLVEAGAGDGDRTRDPQLGKLMLYQLSYSRPMTYGWWGLHVSNQVSITRAIDHASIARAMPVPEAPRSAQRPPGPERGVSQEVQLGFRVLRKAD